MKITKMLAAISAAAVLATAVSATASAVVTPDETDYLTRITADGNAVITAVKTAESTFDIPATIEKNGKEYTVVGVDDFAFALCDKVTVINVPDSLTLEQTGSVAFLTSASVENFLNGKKELGGAKSIEDVIKYIAKKAEYKNGNYTDADLADLTVKLENKIKDIDLSGADDIIGKAMILIKSADQLDLSAKNRNNFDLWLKSITYKDLTLVGSETAPMKEYAEGKALLGMKYQSGYVLGDANGDGKANARDCAAIARAMANKSQFDEIIKNAVAADYNKDGKVDVRDAAQLAQALSKKK